MPLIATWLYTEAGYNSSIGYNYWHRGKDQNITIIGEDNQTIILSKENRSKTVQKPISGGNIIHFPKGDVAIRSNLHFSFNKSSYYIPHLLDIDDKNPNYFIYDGTYQSWIYKEDNIGILGDNLKIKNIKLVFEHESI